MKKLLLSATALVGLTATSLAADLPARRMAPVAPAIAAVPLFTWTGFYVGVQAGYAWGEHDGRVADEFGPFLDGQVDTDGFIGGGHVGYNLQMGDAVFGIEGDIEFADLNGHVTDVAGDRFDARAETNVLGSIRGRLGFAFDRALIYATGGAAFANLDTSYAYTIPANITPGFPGYSESHDFEETVWGWSLGGGVEFAITNHLTTRIEYRYTQFDKVDHQFTTGLLEGASGRLEPELHTVRAGISYKF